MELDIIDRAAFLEFHGRYRRIDFSPKAAAGRVACRGPGSDVVSASTWCATPARSVSRIARRIA